MRARFGARRARKGEERNVDVPQSQICVTSVHTFWLPTPPETLASPSSVKVQTSAPRPSRAARANRVCAVVRATPPTLHLLVQASRKPGRCVSLLAGNLRMQAVFIAVKALRWKVKCIGRFPRKRNEHAALASNAPPRCSYDAPK